MNKLILKNNSTTAEALQLLDANGNGFLPVVSEENVLIGVITDGDVRRALLHGNTELKNIINYKPITAPAGIERREIHKQLLKLRRRHMPVVDDQNRLIDIYVLNDFAVEKKANKIVLMAGGLGSRLGELTKDMPKPMLHVGGKPILQHIVELLRGQGYYQFIFCVNYKAEIIKDYFKDGSWLNVKIEYSQENKRLGTAGPLTIIDKSHLTEPFFVINGDVLTSIDYNDFIDAHINAKAMASVGVKRHEYYIPYACMNFDLNSEHLLAIEEKPTRQFFINTGLYVLNPEVLKFLPDDQFFDMPDLIQHLLNNNYPVKVFRINDDWIDIGAVSDYHKANEKFTR